MAEGPSEPSPRGRGVPQGKKVQYDEGLSEASLGGLGEYPPGKLYYLVPRMSSYDAVLLGRDAKDCIRKRAIGRSGGLAPQIDDDLVWLRLQKFGVFGRTKLCRCRMWS
jgi:hypothetical protein